MIPSDYLDGMSPDNLPHRVPVDALLVVHEVLVDAEAHHHGSVRHQLKLDLFSVREDGQGTFLAEVLGVGLARVRAFVLTVAILIHIWFASLWDNALINNIVHSLCELPSIAPKILKTARD